MPANCELRAGSWPPAALALLNLFPASASPTDAPALRLTATTWPRLIAGSHAFLGFLGPLAVETRDDGEAGGGCVLLFPTGPPQASPDGVVSGPHWASRLGGGTCRCCVRAACLADRDCTVASVPVGAKRAGARSRRGSGRASVRQAVELDISSFPFERNRPIESTGAGILYCLYPVCCFCQNPRAE